MIPARSQGVAEAECRRAADAAEAAYVAAFKDVAADEAALDAEHQRSMAAAREAYAAGAMGKPPHGTLMDQAMPVMTESNLLTGYRAHVLLQSVSGSAGDEAVKKANEQRFTERLDNRFAQLKQQLLASAESECRKMISDITARLTQVNPALPSRCAVCSCARGFHLR